MGLAQPEQPAAIPTPLFKTSSAPDRFDDVTRMANLKGFGFSGVADSPSFGLFPQSPSISEAGARLPTVVSHSDLQLLRSKELRENMDDDTRGGLFQNLLNSPEVNDFEM